MSLIYQAGVGQQGTRNLEKLEELFKNGADIEVGWIADKKTEKAEKTKEKLKVAEHAEIFKYATDMITDALEGGCNTGFHSEYTSARPKNLMHLVAEMKRTGHALDSLGLEKPALTNYEDTKTVMEALNEAGTIVVENAIESFNIHKQAVVADVRANRYNIKYIDNFRGGDNMAKKVMEGRPIPRTNDTARKDKNSHDIDHINEVLRTTDGLPEFKPHKVDDKILRIEKKERKLRELQFSKKPAYYYFTRDGRITTNPSKEPMNTSYSEAWFYLGSTGVHMAASQFSINEKDAANIKDWMTPEMRSALKEESKKEPKLIIGERGNRECRAVLMLGETQEGEEMRILTSTYSQEGFAPYFTVKQVGGGDAEVLTLGNKDQSGKTYKDAHFNYVLNVVNAAKGKKAPILGRDLIESNMLILDTLDTAGWKNAVENNSYETIKLNRHPKKFEEVLFSKKYN